jgi:hypothetical protein
LAYFYPVTKKQVMRSQKLSFLLVCLVIGLPEVCAQAGKTKYHHAEFWTKTEINQIFDNNWGVGIDYVHRRKNEMGEGSMFDHLLRQSVRPWVHYQFSPLARFSFSPIGYMYTNEYVGKPSDYNREPYHEYRTTFQYFNHVKQVGGKVMHTFRYRYELRWQYQPPIDDYRFFHRVRFRYRIRYCFNTDNFYENRTFYTAVSNEIGVNYGKQVPYMFNQSRFYAGLGYRFLNAMRCEVRYMDRLRGRGGSGFEYDHGHGLMISLYVDQLTGITNKSVPSVRFNN